MPNICYCSWLYPHAYLLKDDINAFWFKSAHKGIDSFHNLAADQTQPKGYIKDKLYA